MFHRGDLVLEKDDRGLDWNVYLLIDLVNPRSTIQVTWWVRNLGALNHKNGWSKNLIMTVSLNNKFSLKISPEELSEEKQRVYQEFKTNYLDKDLV